MRSFFVHKSNMYLLISVSFQWRQHSVVPPEHWPPIEQSLHLLIKFFILFIIRYQNIGSTSHSSRVRRTPFLLRFLTRSPSLPIAFTIKGVRSFSSPKREEPLVRPRNDDVWELNECGNSMLYWKRPTAPIWLVVPRGKFASAKLKLATRECELLITGQEIAGLKEGLGVVVLAL